MLGMFDRHKCTMNTSCTSTASVNIALRHAVHQFYQQLSLYGTTAQSFRWVGWKKFCLEIHFISNQAEQYLMYLCFCFLTLCLQTFIMLLDLLYMTMIMFAIFKK